VWSHVPELYWLPSKTETLDEESAHPWDASATSHPGLVVVHSGERPQRLVLPLVDGALEVGRDELEAAGIPDSRASRRHLRIELDDDGWTVRDVGSRNGTFVDGRETQSARRLIWHRHPPDPESPELLDERGRLDDQCPDVVAQPVQNRRAR
jgi:hypothetical protein